MSTELYEEPISDNQRAGLRTWDVPKSPYRKFLDDEGIPVYAGIGFHNVRELDLGDWDRLGGRGAYLYLDGIENIKGMYVLEIPSGGVLNPEQHLYHQVYLVLEGSGTTEMWREGSGSRRVFEWHEGSIFYLPPNVQHRMVNGTGKRVLILAATNAPPVFNLHRERDFIFDNPYDFKNHYSERDDLYALDEKIYAFPLNRRAQMRNNLIPDVVNANLPLDNQRTPGFRRIQIAYQGFEEDYCGFVSQYEPGRYARAHYHEASAVLVCLRGSGYMFSWPRAYGINPWSDGNGDKVRVLDYVPGGLVVAAPGGGQWFHQQFAASADPYRELNFWGGPEVRMYTGLSDQGSSGQLSISEGGSSIGFSVEDPYVREKFQAELAKAGLESTMPESLYRTD